MGDYSDFNLRMKAMEQLGQEQPRFIDPSDIYVPPGYVVENFIQGLDGPVNMVFTDDGDILVAESGYFSGVARILRISNDNVEVVDDDFLEPLNGVNYHDGIIYASHKGMITAIEESGSRRDIITGLPSNGDFPNSKVEIGTDGKIYFGLGTATNSGVVGTDNLWVHNYALLHDYPGSYIMLNGQNFQSNNMLLSEGVYEVASTGAFSPYGVPNRPYELRKAVVKASGSIMRCNLDGTNLEMVAWGLRNPVRLKFNHNGHLFASVQGYDNRGSRPVANASDYIYYIIPGVWYGWPDFSGQEPLTSPRFIPEGGKPIEFLLTNHPNVPPAPFASFPSNSSIMGFDINRNAEFGAVGDFYVAEFGSIWPPTSRQTERNPGVGHKISRIDPTTGGVTTFAINRSGFPANITMEGGFGWPTDVVFGPDGAMYVLDFGTNPLGSLVEYRPNSGIIWKITRI